MKHSQKKWVDSLPDQYKAERIDFVVHCVMKDLKSRSKRGLKEYGKTLSRSDYNLRDWLLEAYFETLDKANYLRAAINKIDEDSKLHND